MTRSRLTPRLYVDISLTLKDIDYLSRMFSVVQQLPDYIVALQDVLPYVTASLTSVHMLNLHVT